MCESEGWRSRLSIGYVRERCVRIVCVCEVSEDWRVSYDDKVCEVF